MPVDSSELLKENRILKRKLKIIQQSLGQFNCIKNKYDDLIFKLEEKDKKLLEMNERLELLVNTRTQELVSINEKLLNLSVTDALTGLQNRRSFDEIFSQEFNRAKRQKYYFNFLIIDVDHFKNYNDTYGHKKGDIVLAKIGEILSKFARRANDFAFRYGGEEFVYISAFHDEEDFFKLADAIRLEIFNEHILHSTNCYDYVSISIGATISLSNEKTKEEIFEIADENLYKAKKNGRNMVVISSI